MQLPPPFYPLKILSRSLPAARANRLRLAWFALGAAAGVAITLALTSQLAVAPQAQPFISEAPPSTPAETVESKPAPTANAYPLALTLKIERGDTLMQMLIDTGVSRQEAHNAIQAIGKSLNVKRLGIGQEIAVELDKAEGGAPVIKTLSLPLSRTATIEIRRKAEGGFESRRIQAAVKHSLMRAGGGIDGSMYETLTAQGLPPSLLADIITAFSYDVDFQRDLQPGDIIDVLYERLETEDGSVAGYGNILYAELQLGKRELKIYRYADKSGRADYYNEKGESVRKALLRTPINGAKITSRFGMRSHPILGYSKMHRGVDFGAPTGTPIYAAGDGKVGFMGRKGGYGNYLRLEHGNGYATAYAHISRFAKSIKPGSRVKQGQVVAYVGSSGMSTGPHLHYEVLAKGAQVNPASVKFKAGNILGGKELAAFKQQVATVEAQLATPPVSAPGEEKPYGLVMAEEKKL